MARLLSFYVHADGKVGHRMMTPDGPVESEHGADEVTVNVDTGEVVVTNKNVDLPGAPARP